ncbi:hypothetical protein WT83_14165 [Burkholderia territorii]|uniref:Uncharacterized protein n=1 Tax=Burkholderia territorii TaxID=1503055 RepID=A0A119VKK6_9BURK|nr:hypothetical protein WT83_14165 [Burkholderia territorii]
MLRAAVELVFGPLLAAGCLTRVSALWLIACGLRTSLDDILRIPIGLGPADWLGEMLYRPEALYRGCLDFTAFYRRRTA